MTKAKTKIKAISETKLINSGGCTRLTKFYDLNGKKFRIHYENSNGSNSMDMYLSQYDGNKWNFLDTIDIIYIDIHKPIYYAHEDSIRHLNEFFNKMETHLVTIYS